MAATIQTGIQGISTGLAGGTSSAANITTNQVIKAAPGIIARLVCIVAGSINLYDCATVGAEAATNLVYSNTAATVGQTFELDWPCGAGICANVASGTFALSFS